MGVYSDVRFRDGGIPLRPFYPSDTAWLQQGYVWTDADPGVLKAGRGVAAVRERVWQPHGEGAAFLQYRGYFHGAAVALDDGLRDGQTQTRVARRAGASFVATVETLENVREVLRRDPRA